MNGIDLFFKILDDNLENNNEKKYKNVFNILNKDRTKNIKLVRPLIYSIFTYYYEPNYINFFISIMYQYGLGIKKNKKRYIKFLQKSTCPYALNNMAYYYYQNNNITDAISLFLRNGKILYNSYSLLNLGILCLRKEYKGDMYDFLKGSSIKKNLLATYILYYLTKQIEYKILFNKQYKQNKKYYNDFLIQNILFFNSSFDNIIENELLSEYILKINDSSYYITYGPLTLIEDIEFSFYLYLSNYFKDKYAQYKLGLIYRYKFNNLKKAKHYFYISKRKDALGHYAKILELELYSKNIFSYNNKLTNINIYLYTKYLTNIIYYYKFSNNKYSTYELIKYQNDKLFYLMKSAELGNNLAISLLGKYYFYKKNYKKAFVLFLSNNHLISYIYLSLFSFHNLIPNLKVKHTYFKLATYLNLSYTYYNYALYSLKILNDKSETLKYLLKANDCNILIPIDDIKINNTGYSLSFYKLKKIFNYNFNINFENSKILYLDYLFFFKFKQHPINIATEKYDLSFSSSSSTLSSMSSTLSSNSSHSSYSSNSLNSSYSEDYNYKKLLKSANLGNIKAIYTIAMIIENIYMLGYSLYFILYKFYNFPLAHYILITKYKKIYINKTLIHNRSKDLQCIYLLNKLIVYKNMKFAYYDLGIYYEKKKEYKTAFNYFNKLIKYIKKKYNINNDLYFHFFKNQTDLDYLQDLIYEKDYLFFNKSLFKLGQFYEYGLFVKQNYKKACQYYKLNNLGCYNLANILNKYLIYYYKTTQKISFSFLKKYTYNELIKHILFYYLNSNHPLASFKLAQFLYNKKDYQNSLIMFKKYYFEQQQYYPTYKNDYLINIINKLILRNKPTKFFYSKYCCICLNDIQPTSSYKNKILYLECGHYFDFMCIKEYLLSSNNDICPICRTLIKNPFEFYIDDYIDLANNILNITKNIKMNIFTTKYITN